MQRHSDTLLLEEAYRATQLTQYLPNMTVQQVQLVIENGSPAELEILDEGLRSMLGGAGNVLKGGKEALGRTASAVKGAAQRAGDAVKAGGSAVGAAAGQVAKNVKGMYDTGKSAAEATRRKEQLIDHLSQLEDLYNAHKEVTKDARLTAPFDRLTFGQLRQRLGATEGKMKMAAQKARSQGFLGGSLKAAGIAGRKALDKAKEEREARKKAEAGDPSRYAGPATA